ncbi:MAG: diaminopimelate epimerase, partial [Armatimonadota bacterium]
MSLAIPFAKFHGAGNDFVVVDAAQLPPGLELSALARALCDRHRGAGADGLLVASPGVDSDLSMAIHNADGSEDTMCGNGVRCLIRHAIDTGRAPQVGVVATRSGPVPYRAFDSGAVEVQLSEPRFSPEAIPATSPSTMDVPVAGIRVDLLNTGSAHAVAFVDALPDPATVRLRSPAVENDPRFPERVSVMWTRIERRDRIRIAIWERGVGETLACGTGAVAAVVASARRGWVDAEVEVESPG